MFPDPIKTEHPILYQIIMVTSYYLSVHWHLLAYTIQFLPTNKLDDFKSWRIIGGLQWEFMPHMLTEGPEHANKIAWAHKSCGREKYSWYPNPTTTAAKINKMKTLTKIEWKKRWSYLIWSDWQRGKKRYRFEDDSSAKLSIVNLPLQSRHQPRYQNLHFFSYFFELYSKLVTIL